MATNRDGHGKSCMRPSMPRTRKSPIRGQYSPMRKMGGACGQADDANGVVRKRADQLPARRMDKCALVAASHARRDLTKISLGAHSVGVLCSFFVPACFCCIERRAKTLAFVPPVVVWDNSCRLPLLADTKVPTAAAAHSRHCRARWRRETSASLSSPISPCAKVLGAPSSRGRPCALHPTFVALSSSSFFSSLVQSSGLRSHASPHAFGELQLISSNWAGCGGAGVHGRYLYLMGPSVRPGGPLKGTRPGSGGPGTLHTTLSTCNFPSPVTVTRNSILRSPRLSCPFASECRRQNGRASVCARAAKQQHPQESKRERV